MMNQKIILPVLIAGILLLDVITIYAQQNQNNVETRIEIKISGEVNETQKAEINDLLNNFENQNPRLKIDSKIKGEKLEREGSEERKGGEGRESKVQKYHFIPIVIWALSIIFLLWLFTAIKKSKKRGINLLNNIFMGLVFLFSAISGVLLIYGYKSPGFDLKFWHVIVSLFLLFAIIFHIITHWNTWVSYFKRIFRTKR